MTDRFFEELKEKSKNGIVFHVLKNNEWVVCENIGILPFLDDTLENVYTKEKNALNLKIEALEKRCEKQEAIIKELIEAIKTLNKGGNE